jgi:hypothetical protein
MQAREPSRFRAPSNYRNGIVFHSYADALNWKVRYAFQKTYDGQPKWNAPRTGSIMRKRTALAVLAVAIGALFHFWPEDESRTPGTELKNGPAHDSPTETMSNSAHQPQISATPRAPSGERVAQSASTERSAATQVNILIHAPQSARLEEIVPVTIEIQVMQGIRDLEFSVVYNKQILELLESSPGPFVQQGGASAQFEEVSEGSLLIRVGSEGGVIFGSGSVAVVQFRTLRRGESPLAIIGVRYVVVGRQNESNDPIAYEGTITVD